MTTPLTPEILEHYAYSALIAREREVCCVLSPDELDALLSTARRAKELESQLAAAQAEEGEWQPIASAPKDGTMIIGLADGCVRVCTWVVIDNPVAKAWNITGSWHQRKITSGKDLIGFDFNPTHWMPLPPVPAAPEQTWGGE